MSKLKYDPVNSTTVNNILTKYKNEQVLEYIKELYSLIEYQRQRINEQEKMIIALKHTEAWKHYDKPIDSYDVSTRKYVDKPAKSDNISC